MTGQNSRTGRIGTTLIIESQDTASRAKANMPEEISKLGFLPSDTNRMTEAVVPGHQGARLIGIQFPRVEVKHDGPSLAGIHMPDTVADDGRR